ncbi:YodC family protein [Chromohalobacter israelensis]
MDFKKGDVVQLKSGGPKMTVTGVIGEDNHLRMLTANGFEEGDVTVEYFNGNSLERNTFRKSSLITAE